MKDKDQDKMERLRRRVRFLEKRIRERAHRGIPDKNGYDEAEASAIRWALEQLESGMDSPDVATLRWVEKVASLAQEDGVAEFVQGLRIGLTAYGGREGLRASIPVTAASVGADALRGVARLFQRASLAIPAGAAWQSGPLADTSICNVHSWAIRKLLTWAEVIDDESGGV